METLSTHLHVSGSWTRTHDHDYNRLQHIPRMHVAFARSAGPSQAESGAVLAILYSLFTVDFIIVNFYI